MGCGEYILAGCNEANHGLSFRASREADFARKIRIDCDSAMA